MLKEGLGFLAMLLGIMGGDSDYIILPTILIIMGAVLILTSKGEK